MLVNISMKFHEDILNRLKVIGYNFVTETATYKVQRAKLYISKSYGSCDLHIDQC